MVEAVSVASVGERDIEFNAGDFERVRAMIRAKAGIDLNPGKQNMVYSRLSRRLRERGYRAFRPYLDSLQTASEAEWQEFINCLTTNLTSFFREAHHFPILAEHLRRRHPAPQRIWCCAASTGEEPYTIAMTAVGTLGAQAPVTIDASDIDTRVLETARMGAYSAESVASLDAGLLHRHFLKGSGANAGRVRVKPDLRGMVNFRPFNLLSDSYRGDGYDAIFCRNVMIYFDRPMQRRVLEKLHGCLRPDGLLFVGHSENFTEHRDLFSLVGKTVYSRVKS
jgi:chemotaxis protein methyltransferase CheR